MMSIVIGPKWSFYSCCDYIGLLGTSFMQVLHLVRPPRTKETLVDFLKWCRVTRHPLVFRGLTDSQRTLGFGVSHNMSCTGIWSDSRLKEFSIESKNVQIGVRTRKLWSSKVGGLT